jgi:predicted DNA-binding protein (UPF0251 family)
MPRPKRPRSVSGYPTVTSFAPEEFPATGEEILSVEGLEAIRLSDFEGLNQVEAAGIMGVSRQTYGRILNEARHIIALAIITGRRLVISGGVYEMRRHRGRHRRRHGRFGRPHPMRNTQE